MAKGQRESFYKGQRYVLFDGRITNSGRYPLVNVGLDIDNITEASGTWHLIYDPATNTSYLPLREGPLRPGRSQDFGFIMPLESGFPNVSLHQVTTPNALYSITAANLFDEEKPREMLPPGSGTTTTLEESGGGVRVPYPPAHGRVRGENQQQEPAAGNATTGEQQQEQQEQQEPAATNATTVAQPEQPREQPQQPTNATAGDESQQQQQQEQQQEAGNTTAAEHVGSRGRRRLRDL
jgi:hypothetical protein